MKLELIRKEEYGGKWFVVCLDGNPLKHFLINDTNEAEKLEEATHFFEMEKNHSIKTEVIKSAEI